MTERAFRPLVLDTSVAVKWYLTEELDDQAARLLEAAESGVVEFLAPSTIQPELFNALWQRRRRGELTPEEVHQVWGALSPPIRPRYTRQRISCPVPPR